MDARVAQLPFLGYGLGLRAPHYQTIIDTQPNVDWFEILTENYLTLGGQAIRYLAQIRQDYPIVMHGVSLSIGSADPLDEVYLKQMDALIDWLEPAWLSDHLCWTGVAGHNSHDLLPLPYTEAVVEYIVDRVDQVQTRLQRPILLENLSSYVGFAESEMPEWVFFSEIVQRSGCYMLLDVNNIYVSARNHGFDPMAYLEGMPVDKVQQIHLAGHLDLGTHIIDTHDHPIIEPVWDLYAAALQRFGRVSSMIERDDDIPPLATLLAELDQVRAVAARVLGAEHAIGLGAMEAAV